MAIVRFRSGLIREATPFCHRAEVIVAPDLMDVRNGVICKEKEKKSKYARIMPH